MSGGYYNNQQLAYAGQAEAAPQHMQQVYGFQNPGSGPTGCGRQQQQQQQQQQQYASEEYLRQLPTSPFPTAPIHMAEPVCMTQPPPPQEQPRVIVVQPPPPRDDCCELASCICRCIDWLIARVCQVLVAFVLLVLILGLGIWLINKYRHH